MKKNSKGKDEELTADEMTARSQAMYDLVSNGTESIIIANSAIEHLLDVVAHDLYIKEI
jgi:hypothetical protein